MSPASLEPHAAAPLQWFPGHIARAERQLKEQLRLVDVARDSPRPTQTPAAAPSHALPHCYPQVLDVRDARIPLSTGHPSVPAWIGSKLRLVVLNQMDKVSPSERSRWAAHFSRAASTRVVFTNAREGEGVARLAKLALSVSEGLNAKRAEKGLRPRPVRAAVVGFPNVGKSALINRLLGRAQCASAARPGVTRHLQWVSLGATGDLMLLDAPGVLPMRLQDQDAAVRLAICNDIGEASYTTSLVAAAFVDALKTGEAAAARCAALAQRYGAHPAGLSGEDYIQEVARISTLGDTERAGRRILKDYQEGRLGAFCLEHPPPAASLSAAAKGDPLLPPSGLSAWPVDGPSRRAVKLAAKAEA